MAVIQVKVSDNIAKQFIWREVVDYEEILDYEDNLQYNFSDEKVSLEEISSFLWNVISNNKKVC